MSSSDSKFLLGFLAGAAIGALAGILFATDKGSETRKVLNEKAKKIKDDLQQDMNEKIDELKDYLDENVEEVKTKASRTAQKAYDKVKAKKAEA